jgi:hypothetical protein
MLCEEITKLAFANSLGVIAFGSVAPSPAQQLTADQIQTIKETAASVCNTVNEAKGRKSDSQIQVEVNAQMKNLLGKVFPVGASLKGIAGAESAFSIRCLMIHHASRAALVDKVLSKGALGMHKP